MSPNGRGRLIAMEGIDGCGKSTQAKILAEALGAVVTREPGGTAFGEVLRNLLLDPPGPDRTARAEALLMAADRAQHVAEIIEPALRKGQWVVTDRYSGSTLAYQGAGRGLAVDDLGWLSSWAAEGVEADLSVLIDVDPELARRRLAMTSPDRLERMDPGFHHRVRQGFVELARAGGDRWVVVNGSGDADSVARGVADAVRRFLGEPASSPAPSPLPAGREKRFRGNVSATAGGPAALRRPEPAPGVADPGADPGADP